MFTNALHLITLCLSCLKGKDGSTSPERHVAARMWLLKVLTQAECERKTQFTVLLLSLKYIKVYCCNMKREGKVQKGVNTFARHNIN